MKYQQTERPKPLRQHTTIIPTHPVDAPPTQSPTTPFPTGDPVRCGTLRLNLTYWFYVFESRPAENFKSLYLFCFLSFSERGYLYWKRPAISRGLVMAKVRFDIFGDFRGSHILVEFGHQFTTVRASFASIPPPLTTHRPAPRPSTALRGSVGRPYHHTNN